MTKFNRSAREARLAARGRRPSTSELAAKIVAAFVSRNQTDAADIADLLISVETALVATSATAQAASQPLVPAVPVAESITADYIVCLEDGRKMKSMKRHLRSFGLTPDSYRAKWGLPSDYPMVAPNYSVRRTELAKASGLGRKADAPATVQDSTAFLNLADTIGDDGIINLLDGRVVRDLGRDLARRQITSDDYRAQFGLPANYPMKVSRSGPFLKGLAV